MWESADSCSATENKRIPGWSAAIHKEEQMKILILNGSPHPNGTTAQLRAAFEAGALSLPNSNYIEEAEKSGAYLS